MLRVVPINSNNFDNLWDKNWHRPQTIWGNCKKNCNSPMQRQQEAPTPHCKKQYKLFDSSLPTAGVPSLSAGLHNCTPCSEWQHYGQRGGSAWFDHSVYLAPLLSFQWWCKAVPGRRYGMLFAAPVTVCRSSSSSIIYWVLKGGPAFFKITTDKATKEVKFQDRRQNIGRSERLIWVCNKGYHKIRNYSASGDYDLHNSCAKIPTTYG